jgi:hypothetical protein
MSYYSAKQKYEQENKTDLPRYVCTVCMMEAEHKDMVTYGARCWKCYDDYCKSAPRYQPQPVFAGDQKDWARRIMNKQKHGEPVSKIAVQFAKEALRLSSGG